MNAPETFEPASNVTTMPYAPRSGCHLDDAELNACKQRSRRATFVKWLGRLVGRRIRALIRHDRFSAEPSGRAVEGFDRRTAGVMQMAVPAHSLKSPMKLGKRLKQELKLDGNIDRPKRESAHPVGWGDQKTMQPELWTVAVVSPGGSVAAEY